MGSEILKIYPSGFLGNPEVALTQSMDILAIKNHLFSNAPIGKSSGYTANLEVENLWEDVVAGDAAYKTFEFREKILKVALRAFGTKSIFQWIAAQAESDLYTDYHHRWIDETLKYAVGGVSREYAYSAWFALFACGSSDKDALISPTVVSYLGRNGEKDIPIDEFIVRWASQPRGIDDMIESLHILFGKR